MLGFTPSDGGTVGLAGALVPPPRLEPVWAEASDAPNTITPTIAAIGKRISITMSFLGYPAANLLCWIDMHISTIVEQPRWLHVHSFTLLRQIGRTHRDFSISARNIEDVLRLTQP